MLKPEPMVKLAIAGHKKDQGRAIEVLHQKRALHIIEHRRGELDIGTPLRESEEVAFLSLKIRALINLLGITKKAPKRELKFLNLKEARKDVLKLESAVQKRHQELKEIDERAKAIRSKLALLEKLTFFKGDLALLHTLKGVTLFVGTVRKGADLTPLSQLTRFSEMHTAPGEKRDFIFLAIDKEAEGAAHSALTPLGFTPEPLAQIADLHGTPKDNLLRLYPELERLQKREQAAKTWLNTIRSRHDSSLLIWERYLATLSEKTQAPLKFAITKNTFIVSGYVPARTKDQVIASLLSATKNRLAIEELQIDEHHDHVPVKLRNPALVRPFEFLLDLYSLPNHHEIDPTIFMFLGFPIFFGFMLGDIGYGLVSLLLFLALRKALPGMRALINIMTLSAISSIAFGFVFGEFFGAEELFGREIPYLIHRTHDIPTMIMLSVAIGVVHIIIGLLIGMYNEYHHAGIIKALTAKGGWLVFLAGAGILLNELAFKALAIPNGMLAGSIITIVSLIMLFIGEGVRGLVELPGIFGNILSYARLMALGVASAGLAVVINELATPLFRSGIIGIIAGTLILLIGHTVNLALGLIGPFLHSLRLQYVEFFTKFYQGGGIKYNPFGMK